MLSFYDEIDCVVCSRGDVLVLLGSAVILCWLLGG
jgi:hypothetical protein